VLGVESTPGSVDSSGPLVSIVIAACNEERVIGDCLTALVGTADPGELDVVVVCNGCADRTAEVARSFGPPVRVLETPVANKAAALRLGDEAARCLPRIYLDADIELPTAAVRALADSLEQPGVLAATVTRSVDLSGCSWFVRSHYRARSRAPYPDHLVGRGVYALSAQGRARFAAFPLIIADDRYVQGLFRPDECVEIAWPVTIRAPRSARGLLRATTRVAAGNLQERAYTPDQTSSSGRSSGGTVALIRAHRSPARWGDLALYLATVSLARVLAHRRLRTGTQPQWRSDRRPPMVSEDPDGSRAA